MKKIISTGLFALLFSAGPLLAEVKLASPFTSHMVLQQGAAVPVWGTADAGEEVTVSFGAQKQTTKADDKGHWEVKLAPLTVSEKPQDLTVAIQSHKAGDEVTLTVFRNHKKMDVKVKLSDATDDQGRIG